MFGGGDVDASSSCVHRDTTSIAEKIAA